MADKIMNNNLEESEKFPYVCQYIIGKGSNDDPYNKNGVAHILEHYLIHSSYKNDFFDKKKILGFTSFYYTCYYWYACSQEEAVKSYQKFEEMIDNAAREDNFEIEIFEHSKKEVKVEIRFQIKEDKILNTLLLVLNASECIFLPVGKQEDLKNIEAIDIINFINNYYISSNTYKYVFNRNNEIFYMSENNLKRFNVPFHNIIIKKNNNINYKLSKNVFEIYKYNIDDSIRIMFVNNFYKSFTEIILGDIFLMQLCEYLNKSLILSNSIRYEKFFIKDDMLYYIITINNIKSNRFFEYIQKIEKLHFNIFKKLGNILDEVSYNKIMLSMIDYLLAFEHSKIDEKEIRMDLINYSILKYNAYSLVCEKMYIINSLRNLKYNEYINYIYFQIILLLENRIKIIY